MRIGLSTRIDSATGYQEFRDALSHDWAEFMHFGLPESPWLAIPNIGTDVVKFIQQWQLDGFILTGGNDVGSIAERDNTETVILDYACANQMPVFGICRGLHVLNHYFGGNVSSSNAVDHVSATHSIRFNTCMPVADFVGETVCVNSYHHFGIQMAGLAEQCRPIALSEDYMVEAITVLRFPFTAVQWHPERHRPFREYDRMLVRQTFGLPVSRAAGYFP